MRPATGRCVPLWSPSARVVMLLGRVPSYYLKQIAQMTALTVPGTHQIDNRLDVVSPND